MKIAKQFTAFLLVVALCAAFSGCSGTPAVSDEPAKANRFPLELETVNGIMEDNGIPLQARESQPLVEIEGKRYITYTPFFRCNHTQISLKMVCFTGF